MPYKVFPNIFPSAGGGLNIPRARKGIRLARYGCTNRPFFHIVVNHLGRHQHQQPIEQLGSYDPLANHKNEQLVALNVERIQYWIGEGAQVSQPLAELLGLAGILPVHPYSLVKAWRQRKNNRAEAQNQQAPNDAVSTSTGEN